jgi:ankyrin repeat protein
MLVLNQILIDRTARRSMLRATREPQRVLEMRAKQYHEGSMSNREILRTLLAAGANPNLKAKNGDTALIIAFPTKRETSPAMNSKIPGLTSTDVYSPELVNELLAGGADPNLRTNYGLTPLMIAASRGLFEIVKTLLDYGADVNIKADFALTAYDVAEGEGVIEALKKARGPRK